MLVDFYDDIHVLLLTPIIVIYLFEYSTFRAHLASTQWLHACLAVQIQPMQAAKTEREREQHLQTNVDTWRPKNI